MDDTEKQACGCQCHACHCGHMAGGHQAWSEDHEWTKDELTHKKEKLEKKLAWVNEKLESAH